MDTKSRGKVWKTEYLHNLQLFPHRMLVSRKGENSYCTVEKNGQNFDLVIKINITNEWQMDTVTSDMTP